MSAFLRYMLSTEYGRYRDVIDVEARASSLSAQTSGHEQELYRLSTTVGQLVATVKVLTRTLAEAGLLDTAKIEAAIKAEIRNPGEDKEVHCTRCNKAGMQSTMVKVGADTWCRECARNP
jgi:hypothetical protein